jgi:hypothetical protein
VISNPRYTVGRISAVASRPLCLFLANNFLPAGTATSLAVTFLASSLALVFIAADTHRRYYVREFEVEKRSNSLVFYVYIVSVVLLTALGALFVFGLVYYFTRSLSVAFVACAYFGTEKLADESLRHKLFERAFAEWGDAATARGLLQVAGIVAALALGGFAASPTVLLSVLALGAFLVFGSGAPLRIARRFVSARPGTVLGLARRAVSAMKDAWILWVIALLGASMGYVDRIIALLVVTELLPLFMLVVMAFSVLQMSVDFYYISGHRTDFLQGRISTTSVFTNGTFLKSLVGGLVVASVGCVAVLALAKNGSAFPIAYVIAIALLQITAALAAAPFQILYWRGELKRILLTELGFWSLLAVSAITIELLKFPPSVLFAAVVACSLIRLGAYVAVPGQRREMAQAQS